MPCPPSKVLDFQCPNIVHCNAPNINRLFVKNNLQKGVDRFLTKGGFMARIPENEIERLKNEVSVERLIEGSGIELKKTGKDLAGKCPFHEDDTASLVVTPSKNLWHCFGCGAAGGPIDWVIKKNGVSFRHAVELLRDGISTLAAAPVKRTTVRALEAPVAPDVDDQVLLDQVIGYYHETLKTSPEALAYLPPPSITS